MTSRRNSLRVGLLFVVGTILLTAGGLSRAGVNTTLNDFQMPGSQPGQSGSIELVSACTTCHGNYSPAVEPFTNWKGSMMAHAARDPLFYACMAIANQDAPESGQLCIRCHSPAAFLGGRSVPTDGSAITAQDRNSVQCGFCHKLIRPTPLGVNPYPNDAAYTSGTYAADQAYLATLAQIPPRPGTGMYVVDSNNTKRGPYTDPFSQHASYYSPLHRDAALCGTCHDVSNPVLSKQPDGTYAPNAMNAPAPSADPYTHFPVERTYSEWLKSAYNTPAGIYAPQFGGNKTHVSTCQDCHMRAVTGAGCNRVGTLVRTDLPLHDLTGGNTFIPKLVGILYPAEVDTAALSAGALRARAMLRKAATLNLTLSYRTGGFRARVRVTNETGHKLPSGYPEGRRMWLNVRAWDATDQLVYESGAYDPATAMLTEGPGVKVYEAILGLSAAQAAATGLTAGPSFHFVLNNMYVKDNRIPPRGFTNAAFDSVAAAPVGAVYADGQYWDDTDYDLPATTRRVTATLYYQTMSKEYAEFLRDENHTNTAGTAMYDLWAGNGRSSPEAMGSVSDTLTVSGVPAGPGPGAPALLATARRGQVRLEWSSPLAGPVRLSVFDVNGRQVASLVDANEPAGARVTRWDAMGIARGIYFVRLATPAGTVARKLWLEP